MSHNKARQKFLFETGKRIEIEDPGQLVEEAKSEIEFTIDDLENDLIGSDDDWEDAGTWDDERTLLTYVPEKLHEEFRKEKKKIFTEEKNKLYEKLNTSTITDVGIDAGYLKWLEEIAENSL